MISNVIIFIYSQLTLAFGINAHAFVAFNSFESARCCHNNMTAARHYGPSVVLVEHHAPLGHLRLNGTHSARLVPQPGIRADHFVLATLLNRHVFAPLVFIFRHPAIVIDVPVYPLVR